MGLFGGKTRRVRNLKKLKEYREARQLREMIRLDQLLWNPDDVKFVLDFWLSQETIDLNDDIAWEELLMELEQKTNKLYDMDWLKKQWPTVMDNYLTKLCRIEEMKNPGFLKQDYGYNRNLSLDAKMEVLSKRLIDIRHLREDKNLDLLRNDPPEEPKPKKRERYDSKTNQPAIAKLPLKTGSLASFSNDVQPCSSSSVKRAATSSSSNGNEVPKLRELASEEVTGAGNPEMKKVAVDSPLTPGAALRAKKLQERQTKSNVTALKGRQNVKESMIQELAKSSDDELTVIAEIPREHSQKPKRRIFVKKVNGIRRTNDFQFITSAPLKFNGNNPGCVSLPSGEFCLPNSIFRGNSFHVLKKPGDWKDVHSLIGHEYWITIHGGNIIRNEKDVTEDTIVIKARSEDYNRLILLSKPWKLYDSACLEELVSSQDNNCMGPVPRQLFERYEYKLRERVGLVNESDGVHKIVQDMELVPDKVENHVTETKDNGLTNDVIDTSIDLEETIHIEEGENAVKMEIASEDEDMDDDAALLSTIEENYDMADISVVKTENPPGLDEANDAVDASLCADEPSGDFFDGLHVGQNNDNNCGEFDGNDGTMDSYSSMNSAGPQFQSVADSLCIRVADCRGMLASLDEGCERGERSEYPKIAELVEIANTEATTAHANGEQSGGNNPHNDAYGGDDDDHDEASVEDGNSGKDIRVGYNDLDKEQLERGVELKSLNGNESDNGDDNFNLDHVTKCNENGTIVPLDFKMAYVKNYVENQPASEDPPGKNIDELLLEANKAEFAEMMAKNAISRKRYVDAKRNEQVQKKQREAERVQAKKSRHDAEEEKLNRYRLFFEFACSARDRAHLTKLVSDELMSDVNNTYTKRAAKDKLGRYKDKPETAVNDYKNVKRFGCTKAMLVSLLKHLEIPGLNIEEYLKDVE